MDYRRIKDALARMRKMPVSNKVFGGVGHRFVVNQPATEKDVRAFEEKYGVALPEDYRGFLLNVGNGGAGPYWGVFPLARVDAFKDEKPFEEGSYFIGKLNQPFPYTCSWNDLTGDPFNNEFTEEEAKTEQFERDLEKFEEGYFSVTDGAIPICTSGCNQWLWLVLTGPERGNIWCDFRNERQGWFADTTCGERTTFGEWYMHWLDSALEKLGLDSQSEASALSKLLGLFRKQ